MTLALDALVDTHNCDNCITLTSKLTCLAIKFDAFLLLNLWKTPFELGDGIVSFVTVFSYNLIILSSFKIHACSFMAERTMIVTEKLFTVNSKPACIIHKQRENILTCEWRTDCSCPSGTHRITRNHWIRRYICRIIIDPFLCAGTERFIELCSFEILSLNTIWIILFCNKLHSVLCRYPVCMTYLYFVTDHSLYTLKNRDRLRSRNTTIVSEFTC